ncbi:hypothetical protein AB0L53_56600 [Nonomuraea sp. NPDC052129]|uniref:hypothetical protein n=1 Tax=Nonomuraea sp. NPDC052129 TaxID=3154651 RepID=UPI00343C9990
MTDVKDKEPQIGDEAHSRRRPWFFPTTGTIADGIAITDVLMDGPSHTALYGGVIGVILGVVAVIQHWGRAVGFVVMAWIAVIAIGAAAAGVGSSRLLQAPPPKPGAAAATPRDSSAKPMQSPTGGPTAPSPSSQTSTPSVSGPGMTYLAHLRNKAEISSSEDFEVPRALVRMDHADYPTSVYTRLTEPGEDDSITVTPSEEYARFHAMAGTPDNGPKGAVVRFTVYDQNDAPMATKDSAPGKPVEFDLAIGGQISIRLEAKLLQVSKLTTSQGFIRAAWGDAYLAKG